MFVKAFSIISQMLCSFQNFFDEIENRYLNLITTFSYKIAVFLYIYFIHEIFLQNEIGNKTPYYINLGKVKS